MDNKQFNITLDNFVKSFKDMLKRITHKSAAICELDGGDIDIDSPNPNELLVINNNNDSIAHININLTNLYSGEIKLFLRNVTSADVYIDGELKGQIPIDSLTEIIHILPIQKKDEYLIFTTSCNYSNLQGEI